MADTADRDLDAEARDVAEALGEGWRWLAYGGWMNVECDQGGQSLTAEHCFTRALVAACRELLALRRGKAEREEPDDEAGPITRMIAETLAAEAPWVWESLRRAGEAVATWRPPTEADRADALRVLHAENERRPERPAEPDLARFFADRDPDADPPYPAIPVSVGGGPEAAPQPAPPPRAGREWPRPCFWRIEPAEPGAAAPESPGSVHAADWSSVDWSSGLPDPSPVAIHDPVGEASRPRPAPEPYRPPPGRQPDGRGPTADERDAHQRERRDIAAKRGRPAGPIVSAVHDVVSEYLRKHDLVLVPDAPIVPEGVPWPADAEGRGKVPAEMTLEERLNLAIGLTEADAQGRVGANADHPCWGLICFASCDMDLGQGLDEQLAALGHGTHGGDARG